MSAWSVAAQRDALSPIAAYVAVKGADYRDSALCTPLGSILETAIQRSGSLDPSHLPELTELAGTHGPASTAEPYPISVTSYEGGPDQSYQLRARALFTGDPQHPAFDQVAFTKWVKAQANAGGRFSLAESDAKEFAAIDVVRYGGRLLVLAVEPWGYYSPAAIGRILLCRCLRDPGTGSGRAALPCSRPICDRRSVASSIRCRISAS